MIALPRSVLALLPCAAKVAGRYSMTGIRVLERKGDAFRLDATDGRKLVIIQGQSPEGWNTKFVTDGETTEESPVFEDTSDTFDYQVPTEAIARAFKTNPDKNGGIVIGCAGDKVSLLSHGGKVESGVVEGRFPDCDLVIPRSEPLFTMTVNAEVLIDVLRAAVAFSRQEPFCKVQVHFYKSANSGHPYGVSCSLSDGTTFDGLVMPLVAE